MNLKKTNIELITGLLNKAANIQRYKKELAKINMLEASKIEIKQAEKDFNELVTEAYYIAFADGRLADLLDDIKLMQKNPEEYVFSGWKQNKGLSNNALLTLLKKMGRSNITVHGFRSTFRDWAAEEAHTFANETIELALAHTIKNKAEAAYRRGDQLERRRELMSAWDYYTNQHSRSKD